MSKKVFIIAEAGVNHNGEIALAYKLVDAAFKAKADAVKFQAFKAEKVISKYAKRAKYQKKNMADSSISQLEMAKKLELNDNDFIKLKRYCDNLGITFLTTAFDYESADIIYDLIKIYKIPSGEITNLPFIKYIARKNKPIILSTGMSYLEEVKEAVRTIDKNQKVIEDDFPRLTLLHCTSNYPASYEDINLKAMLTMKEHFNLPVGYSDHSNGITIPIAATALGATVIEKHFTLDRNLEGPDHKASLEPKELRNMIEAIRTTELALGNGEKKPAENEIEIMQVARRSLVAASKLAKGTILTKEMIEIKRPGTGIPPSKLKDILGKKLLVSKDYDELFTPKDME